MLMCCEDKEWSSSFSQVLAALQAFCSRRNPKSAVHGFYISNLNTANKTDPALGYIWRSVASLPLPSLHSGEGITFLCLPLKRLQQEFCAQLWPPQIRGRMGKKLERLQRWRGAKSTWPTRGDGGIWACLVWRRL